MKLPNPHDAFEAALHTLPCPGGNGYHTALLGVANRGIIAGVDPAELFRLIRAHTPQGGRNVPDHEIREAVEKAARECPTVPWRAKVRQNNRSFDSTAFMAERLREAHGIGEADIVEASPIRLDNEPPQDAVVLLQTLYRPDDFLFIGGSKEAGNPGETIRSRDEWLALFAGGGTPGPHIIPNPLTGRIGRTKSGNLSHRSDSCVAQFRFAVAEFDGLPKEQQYHFWYAVNLPVTALIDSGGKSLHAWIAIDGVTTADAWTTSVEETLFAVYLNKLGVDSSCRNESRLSRMAGHQRSETGRWQRILFLAPEGRAIHESH